MADADVLGGEVDHIAPGADVVRAADGAYVGLVFGLVVEVVEGSGGVGNLYHGAFALAEAAEAVLNLPLAVVVGAGSPGEGCRGAVDGGRKVGDGVADVGGEGDGVAVVALNIAIAAEGAHGCKVLHAGGEVVDGSIGGVAGNGELEGGVEYVEVPLGLARARGPAELCRGALYVGGLEGRRSKARHAVGYEGADGPVGVGVAVAVLTHAVFVGRGGAEVGEGVGVCAHIGRLAPRGCCCGTVGNLVVVAAAVPGEVGGAVGNSGSAEDRLGAAGNGGGYLDVVETYRVEAGGVNPAEGQVAGIGGSVGKRNGVEHAVGACAGVAAVVGVSAGRNFADCNERVVDGVAGAVAHCEGAVGGVLGGEPEAHGEGVDRLLEFGQTDVLGRAVGLGTAGHDERVAGARVPVAA